jgi:hypothetical protein
MKKNNADDINNSDDTHDDEDKKNNATTSPINLNADKTNNNNINNNSSNTRSNINTKSTKCCVKEIHLIEKFSVRLGPTLNLFELCAMGASHLKHSLMLHRMVAVDGEEDGRRNVGVRGSELEVACVSHLWSADDSEYQVLMNNEASAERMQTGFSFY